MSQLTSAVTDHVGTIGRGGVVIAMSSGLVATFTLPAQAQGSTAKTVPNPVSETADAALQAQQAPLTAPAKAKVSFDKGTFKAKRIVKTTATSTQRVSRSTTRSDSSSSAVTSASGSYTGSEVVAVAERYLGVPYLAGGASPDGFDCSGLVMYVFAQFGINLPRTSDGQMGATTRIARSEARAGDLVFFVDSSGNAYHVGIYVGGNMIIDSPKPGQVVQEREIWTSSVSFHRV